MSLPVWQGTNVPDLLEQLRKYVEAQVQSELDWYGRSRSHSAKFSRGIRILAILFTALGGAVPILISLGIEAPLKGWAEWLNFSQLGYLLLGTAAALVGFDRFFGFSTSWMRFVTTAISIEKAREQFRMDWVSLSHKLSRLSPANGEAYDATVDAMINRVREFLLEVKTATEKETQAWVAEFQTNLSQMEKDLRAQLEAGRPGAVDVEITDAARATGGMELYLDGLKVEDVTGATGSIGNVPAGLHKITVKGKSEDREYLASRIVSVTPSAVTALKLALGTPEPPSGSAAPPPTQQDEATRPAAEPAPPTAEAAEPADDSAIADPARPPQSGAPSSETQAPDHPRPGGD